MIRRRGNKIAFLIAFLSMGIIIAGTGCSHGTAAGSAVNDAMPFYSDRVVTVRIVMSEPDWEFTRTNALAKSYVKADLWYDNERIPGVAVRPKGNSSLRTARAQSSLRLPLKVDLNFFNSARDLHGVKKLNFNNGFSDPTLIREALGYELCREMGIPTPRTSFVDLWVNDIHLGLYTMVEQIDKAFLAHHFDAAEGNLYKPAMPAAYLAWTEDDLDGLVIAHPADRTEVNLGGGKLADIMRALEPGEAAGEAGPSQGQPPRMIPPQGMFGGNQNLLEQMGLKTNENRADHSLLFRLLDVLNREPDETFPEEIEKIMDVDEVLRFLAVSTVIVHLDNYTGLGHNYYLYDNDGKFVIIPWDLNMAFGTFNSGLDRDRLINFYLDEPTAGPVAQRPLVDRLLSYGPYLDTYRGYVEELLDGPFDVSRMNVRIDELAALVRPYVEADERKLYSTEDFETALSMDIRTRRPTGDVGGRLGGGMTPIGLKSFVEERSVSLREQLDGTRKSSSGDGSGNGGSSRMGGNWRMR